jgi:tRNA (cmo5U34)-methyltransferase
MWKKNHLYNEDAEIYDSVIRDFVPVYDEMINVVIEAIKIFYPKMNIKVLDIGVGTGNLSLKLLENFPDIELVGYEIAPNLYEFAKRKLKEFKPNFLLKNEDILKNNIHNSFNLIISLLTFHYFDHEQKKIVYKKTYDLLKKNGLFINVDRVISKSDSINKVFYDRMSFFWDKATKTWIEEKREKWKTQDSPEEQPYYLEDQLDWLREIGFTDVECLWRNFNYCVFIGKK